MALMRIRPSRPLFTVIVPCHNSEVTLGRSLESVRSQTFTDYELIVVADNCSDDTVSIAESYKAAVVVCDKGSAGGARNVGLGLASGVYVLFLDSDDRFTTSGVFDELARELADHDYPDVLSFGFYYGHRAFGTTAPDGSPWNNVWSRAWKGDLVRHHRFPEANFAEDRAFVREVLNSANSVHPLERQFVAYTPPRPGSLAWLGGDRPFGPAPMSGSAVPPRSSTGCVAPQDCSVLILSEDRHADLWDPFFLLFARYWKCPYPTYLLTESRVSTHTTTLTHRGPWADRLRAALLKLQSPYVLMIRDDFFLCSPVNQEVVSYALDHFTSRTAGFIFSRSVSDSDYDSDVWGFKVRGGAPRTRWTSLPAVWDRIKLLDSLTAGCDMATWEGPPRASEDAFFINGSAEVFFGGCVANRGFALHGEEWDPGMTGILEREGLELDLRERGVRGDASLREGSSFVP